MGKGEVSVGKPEGKGGMGKGERGDCDEVVDVRGHGYKMRRVKVLEEVVVKGSNRQRVRGVMGVRERG